MLKTGLNGSLLEGAAFIKIRNAKNPAAVCGCWELFVDIPSFTIAQVVLTSMPVLGSTE